MLRLKTFASNFILPLAILCAKSVTADAHGPEGHENLKVIPEDKEPELKDGMKELAKGLGVKCNACHVEKKFDSEKKPEKLAARDFLKAVWTEDSQDARDAALSELLGVLKLEQAKDPKLVWAAIARLGGHAPAAAPSVPEEPAVDATAKAPEPVEPAPSAPAPAPKPPAPVERDESATCQSVGEPSLAALGVALFAWLIMGRRRGRPHVFSRSKELR